MGFTCLISVSDCERGVRDFDICDPETFVTVEVEEYFRRGRNSRCNLYSVGPSWGSASSFRIPLPLSTSVRGNFKPASVDFPLVGLPVATEGCAVGHGDASLFGSVSNVKIEAMISVFRFRWVET